MNMCMGMRMGLHGREWVCMDESLERETVVGMVSGMVMGMECGKVVRWHG